MEVPLPAIGRQRAGKTGQSNGKHREGGEEEGGGRSNAETHCKAENEGDFIYSSLSIGLGNTSHTLRGCSCI